MCLGNKRNVRDTKGTLNLVTIGEKQEKGCVFSSIIFKKNRV